MGNLLQLGGTRPYCLTDGSANGCRCIDVRTGSGFEFTVVCDRGLDISLASYRGINLTFLTANSETTPAFYVPVENEWLRTFTAGFLTTCGPTYLSNPCTDQNERLGLHGRFSCLPGRQICDLTDFSRGTIELTGTLYDAHTLGKKLRIRRRIRSRFGGNSVTVEDEFCNEGGISTPLTMLYHVNFGYPLLSEDAVIHVPSSHCRGYDDYSQQRMEERFRVSAPEAGKLEKNYLHTFEPDQKEAIACIWNKGLDGGLAAYVKFSPGQLPYLTQWVLEDRKDYIVALEPANVPCEPRNILRENNLLPILEPGESRTFRIELGVVSGNRAIEEAIIRRQEFLYNTR